MKELDELVLPDTVRYDQAHEWIAVAAPFRVGVSDFAQDQLGDLTFVELPAVGAAFAKGDEFGVLESAKSVSSLYLPVAGTVTAVNDALRDDPGLVNRDPYGDGWIIEIKPAGAPDGLMDVVAYRRHLEAQA